MTAERQRVHCPAKHAAIAGHSRAAVGIARASARTRHSTLRQRSRLIGSFSRRAEPKAARMTCARLCITGISILLGGKTSRRYTRSRAQNQLALESARFQTAMCLHDLI